VTLIVSLLIAIALALVHLFAVRLHFWETIPRRGLLSAAGGATVAYVFLDLLPRLSASGSLIREINLPLLNYLEHHAYIAALLGLVLFYGLERYAKVSRRARQRDGYEDVTSPAVFWTHIAFYGLYYAAIGYLLDYEEVRGAAGLVLFVIAIGLHFLVIDHALREDHKGSYDQYGRWILAASLLAGWGIAVATDIHRGYPAILFAFVAGAIILIALKEELPPERQSSFWAFVLGALGYTVLLLATWPM